MTDEVKKKLVDECLADDPGYKVRHDRILRPSASVDIKLAKKDDETVRVYLERLAPVMDEIMNHLGHFRNDNTLSWLTVGDMQDLRGYVCSVMADDVEREAAKLSRKLCGFEDDEYTQRVFSYLMEYVFNVIFKYNNPIYLDGREACSFTQFIANHEKQVIKKIISEDKGIKEYLVYRSNEIKKAKEKVARKKEISPSVVTKEEVYEQMGGAAGKYSFKQISETMDIMWLLDYPTPIDQLEEGQNNSRFVHRDKSPKPVWENLDPLVAAENRFNRPDVMEMFNTMSRLQSYVILKRTEYPESHHVSSKMAGDKVLQRLVREDPCYGKEIVGKENDENAGVDGKLVEKIYNSAIRRAQRFLKKKDLEAEDLTGILDDLIFSTLDELIVEVLAKAGDRV